ncbi:MAG: replication and repair protein RecF protein [Parcubacteria group bacterium GW2011_GWB1_41_4]|nr:MAG: replication and repair protein RecF protein [Parcubacteria group bacterium GW2011_GWB1_41_4]
MLKNLILENFRNYQKYDLDFSKTTILIGPNGVGKTNIIEAISLMSTGRSWRLKKDNEAVLWQKDFARISAKIVGDKEKNLEMVLQRLPSPDYPQIKIIKINGVKKRLVELLGKIPTVLFSPEELQIIAGSPQLRRRFIDILICQTDKNYTVALLDLAKIIRGRNKLLYYIKIGKSKIGELDFWNERLVTLGSFIIKKRQKVIAELNLKLSDTYQTISDEKETLQIKYKSLVEPDKFADMIGAQIEREIEATATLFGPHRDDLVFLLENRDVATFGSRGEFRSVILAVKVAELSYLKKANPDVPPILLLDDIFSELDLNRRLHLAKIISGQQTIITTTDFDHIEKGLREKAKVVELTVIARPGGRGNL